MKTIETLNPAPFRHLIATIGELPTSFTESMTYYEMLAWLCDYLEKKVVPAVDNNAEALKELQDFVVHYFDNLDVQEEINNKLDAMAQSGQLEEIIAAYVNASSMLSFDTVDDMQSAENLIDGSYAETLGYYAKNDRGGAIYKIREVTNQDTIDGKFLIALDDPELVAEIVEAGRMYVTQYGIKNDESVDVTDDINYLITNDRQINLVDGTYLIEGTLTGTNISITGESQNSILSGGETKHDVIDGSHSTKVTLLNFACKNGTLKVYGYNGDGGAYSESSISDERDIYVENVWYDEAQEGSGSTYWKLYLKTPKPTDYTRYGHDGYACYPIEITNNSGYNALMINNICTNDEGTVQSVADNSAVGIIDKVASSAPTVLISQQNMRDILKVNTPAPYNVDGTALQFNTSGHMAIGCTVPATTALPGYADIKIRDENPNIIFYSEHSTSTPAQYGLLQYGGNNYTRGFGMYIGGDEVLKACKGGVRTRPVSYATIQGWPASELTEGCQVWDSTNHRPLWFNGTSWINGAGTAVYTPS